ncbi:MAG: Gfo/Idh/MocA family oxidoreductase [Clostridia bacterium]|nr:Gfo/Idh/MocA family oxidoreductase [Clostridia bacterium]MBQ8720297.1 Gfo/Idh/MocA family oxidoreductase [Clostridia bacterium]
MKKLNIAIIGQGRSGKNIHGNYYRSESNKYYTVKYVVDFDERRRKISEEIYPGCTALSDYIELYGKDDIDLVVNATFSETHYSITRDLIEHGFNVLVEKPFGRNKYECNTLIQLAKERGVTLAVFQQSFYAPYYNFAIDLAKSGKLGEIKQVSVAFNGFARRWDWQTLQKKCAGGTFNTGPHPIGIGLAFLDFSPSVRVAYSKLGLALTSGDGDDYSKIILEANEGPTIDIEIISCDAYTDYNIKVMGSRGTLKCTTKNYKYTYITDEENPPKPVIEKFLEDADGNPIYCKESLVKHTEEGTFEGTAFDIGTASLYEELYYLITEGRPMKISCEMAADVIGVIETVIAENPLPVKYI